MKTHLLRPLSLVLVALGLSSPAVASLVLTLDDLGTPGIDVIVVDDVDGGVGTGTAKGASNTADGTAGDGVVTFNGAIGSFDVNVSTGISKPLIGGPNLARIDLNSVNVSSGSAGTLEIMLTDTGFTNPWPGISLRSEVGGTTDGTFELEHIIDFSNMEFGIGGTPISISQGPFGPGAFAGTESINVVNPLSLFSLTENVRITHTAAGQITSFDADPTAMPEPTALALMGLGLAGIGYRSRKVSAS